MLMVWGLSRIVPDVLAHTHGKLADAVVIEATRPIRTFPITLSFLAETDDGLVRGTDQLVSRTDLSPGDRIEIVYFTAGNWRHAIAESRRDWHGVTIPRALAVLLGALICTCSWISIRLRRHAATTVAAPPGS